MKSTLSRLKKKYEPMLRVFARLIRRWSHRFNNRWAWFFTNGMKEPYEEQQLIFPEDFK